MTDRRGITALVIDTYVITGRGQVVIVEQPDPPFALGDLVEYEGVPAEIVGIESHAVLGGADPGGMVGLLLNPNKQEGPVVASTDQPIDTSSFTVNVEGYEGEELSLSHGGHDVEVWPRSHTLTLRDLLEAARGHECPPDVLREMLDRLEADIRLITAAEPPRHFTIDVDLARPDTIGTFDD